MQTVKISNYRAISSQMIYNPSARISITFLYCPLCDGQGGGEDYLLHNKTKCPAGIKPGVNKENEGLCQFQLTLTEPNRLFLFSFY